MIDFDTLTDGEYISMIQMNYTFAYDLWKAFKLEFNFENSNHVNLHDIALEKYKEYTAVNFDKMRNKKYYESIFGGIKQINDKDRKIIQHEYDYAKSLLSLERLDRIINENSMISILEVPTNNYGGIKFISNLHYISHGQKLGYGEYEISPKGLMRYTRERRCYKDFLKFMKKYKFTIEQAVEEILNNERRDFYVRDNSK